VFGGFVRNVKRRDTSHYQLATAGNKQLALWSIDPVEGEMTCSKIQAEGRGNQVREFTCLTFSDNLETLYAGTSSGDFVVCHVKTKSMVTTIPATRQGIRSFLASSHALLIGGGDGTVTRLDATSMHDLNQTNIKGPVVSLTFSPDRSEVLAGTSNGFIYRLRADSLQGRMVCENHSAPIVCVDFSPETSERFATLSQVCV
jgi:cilia- and flagella-associated protein 52